MVNRIGKGRLIPQSMTVSQEDNTTGHRGQDRNAVRTQDRISA